MPDLTLEQAVEQAIKAREEHHLALARLAVCQYQHELAGKLGGLAFLLGREVQKTKQPGDMYEISVAIRWLKGEKG